VALDGLVEGHEDPSQEATPCPARGVRTRLPVRAFASDRAGAEKGGRGPRLLTPGYALAPLFNTCVARRQHAPAGLTYPVSPSRAGCRRPWSR
jgi:hypothetical protein